MKALLHSSLLLLCAPLVAQDATFFSTLQQAIDERVVRDLNQGILIGIHSPQGETFLSAGHFAPQDPRPVTPDTLFEIGGVTTLFTAATAAAMVQQRQLAWTMALNSLLPSDYPLPDFEGDPIRFHDLATHSSGLPRYPSHWEPEDWRNPFSGFDEAAQKQALATTTLQWKPGTRYEFSEWGYGLLALAIATRADKPHRDVLREKITGPLDLNDTVFTLNNSQRERLAPGHIGLTPMPTSVFGEMEGGSGLFSTGRNLLKFVVAQQSRVQSPLLAAFRDIQQIQIETGVEGTMTTRGWHVTLREGQSLFWQSGLSSGYTCFVGFNPNNQRTVVILTNSNEALDAIGFHILAPETFPLPQLPRLVAIPETELDRYVGTYALGPGIDVTITRDGEHLHAEIGDQARVRLYPVSPTRFTHGSSERTLSFELRPGQPAASLTLHEGFRNYQALRKRE